MKLNYLPATIMLLAGAVTCIICILNGYETLYSLKVLLTVLIVFLVIGMFTKTAFIKILELGKKDEEVSDKEESEEKEEEDIS